MLNSVHFINISKICNEYIHNQKDNNLTYFKWNFNDTTICFEKGILRINVKYFRKYKSLIIYLHFHHRLLQAKEDFPPLLPILHYFQECQHVFSFLMNLKRPLCNKKKTQKNTLLKAETKIQNVKDYFRKIKNLNNNRTSEYLLGRFGAI